jgi:phenylpyruvate tautomerase PptA (4-oxalocrotonate tautomerase family)
MAEAITDVLIKLGGGSRENCLVLFQETSAENWAIGGNLVSSPAFSQTLQVYKERTKNLSEQGGKS